MNSICFCVPVSYVVRLLVVTFLCCCVYFYCIIVYVYEEY